jgi:N-acetylneuraminic acid mutarotase
VSYVPSIEKLVFVGGFEFSSSLEKIANTKVHYFDLKSNTWTSTGSILTPGVVKPRLALLSDERILICGGFSPNNKGINQDFYILQNGNIYKVNEVMLPE